MTFYIKVEDLNTSELSESFKGDEEIEEDEDDFIALKDEFSTDVNKELKRVEERKQVALIAHFNEEQLNRFEMYRRATFAKATVKRVMHAI